MTKKKKRLRVIPLGGLDEIGKNMTVLEYGDDLVVIDAGIMFPDDDSPGVDLLLPDYTYVLERGHMLRGIVVTHGHEDHVGCLPYLLKDLDAPVPLHATRLTIGMIRQKLDEFDIRKPRLREVREGHSFELGVFRFTFIPVNHSIPDGVALKIETPVGIVVHSGDFKFDQTPIDGRVTDFAALTQAGEEGVLLLMADSTNAETEGHTRSEAEVGKGLRRLFGLAERRIIVASFASHIHRLQQVCDAALDVGRKVVVTGRSMINTFRIARELGFLTIDDDAVVDAYEMGGLNPEDVVVLCTGSQGEPLSALARIANGDHKTVRAEEGDIVVISASPVPGNEKAVSRVINRLAKAGATVYHKGNAGVHVSGHAAAEELKLMLNMLKPRYFMPIHGETRHLRAHQRIARSVGVPDTHCFIMENGECLELTHTTAQVTEEVPSGVVYVDGLGVGDVGSVVLRDRQHMASDGIAMVVITIDPHRGALVGEPELVTRGLIFADSADGLLEDARARLMKTLQKTSREGVTDHRVIKNAVRESLSQFMWERMRRRPMVIPFVMEV